MAFTDRNMEPPYRESLVSKEGILSSPWTNFFRWVYENLSPLGTERSFQLFNDQEDTVIKDLQFDFTKINNARIKYFIQRITTGTSSVELLESGELHAIYKPKSKTWTIRKVGNGPDNSGVTFGISNNGQVLASSSNEDGEQVLFKCTYRIETLSAKFSPGVFP